MDTTYSKVFGVCSTWLLACLLAACSGDSGQSGKCAEGQTKECGCPGGTSGLQTCTSAGVYELCACSGAGGGGVGASGAGGGVAGSTELPDSGSPLDGDAQIPGSAEIIPEPNDPANFIFDPEVIHTYDIVIDSAAFSMLNDNPGAEQYAQAMVKVDGGPEIGPIGVRYKGSVGSFLAPCTQGSLLIPGGSKTGKCSIKLAFDEYDPEARYHGVRKLNLHSMNNDQSMMRERLGYALFREQGIASPRAVHARVMWNGQLEGLFAAVEQVDGRFTRARFGEGGQGNLYKEIWPIHEGETAYLNALETNRSEMPSAQKILALKDAVAQGAEATAAIIDRDYTLRYMAADRVMINDDGIFRWFCADGGKGNNPTPTGNHNYYWYESATETRLWLIPWDLDHAFDGHPLGPVSPEWTQAGSCACGFGFNTAASCDVLTQHFISWKSDYDAAVDAFLAGPFEASKVEAKLSAWTAQIDAAVQESAGNAGAPSYASWMNAVQALRTTIDNARQYRGYRY